METVPKELRHLRACLVCSLIKTSDQFEIDGCDNCDEFLRMKNNKDNVFDCSSANFDGMDERNLDQDQMRKFWKEQQKNGYNNQYCRACESEPETLNHLISCRQALKLCSEKIQSEIQTITDRKYDADLDALWRTLLRGPPVSAICVIFKKISTKENQLVDRFTRGVYAISVSGRLPAAVIREMKSRGIVYRPRDTSQR
ncbi:hypothetical protein G9C98_001851 [Cotesia typhae]|uniref:Spt4/RpoE2 zinc finger domain-containing protein n=1 Tax=Cotesia typhae TaxID=2053667 RepID=A0A8J5VBM7_9HYME|nr:hypothetical protein G9C98_001851 [Cotesia typhae]